MEEKISFILNGRKVQILTDPSQTLLSVIRNQLGLTGTKYGCGTGFCGACTVLIDNEPVRSCTVPVSEASGKRVLTIEGLSKNGKLHPLQEAFVNHDALQCGYCTPGMLMTALGLLYKNPSPTRAQIIEGLDDNLCRCGAHIRIIEAIEEAAVKMKGGK